MDVGLASARQRQLRRYALYGTAAVVVGTLAYKAYRSDALAQTKQSLWRLRLALQKYSEAMSSGAELCSTLVRDLQSFLQSDSSEMPNSLRQLAKLMQSQEVTQTTAKTVAALYRGVAGEASGNGSNQGVVDKVLEALLSDRGHSLVSVAVSMGARNLVTALAEVNARVSQQQEQFNGLTHRGMVDKILDFMGTEHGRHLAVTSITAFVTNGMRVYMDATLDINFYEDIFSSMARPAHLEAIKQCIGMFAREAVGTALQGTSQAQLQSQQARPMLIQELSPPPSPRSPHHSPDFLGRPLDSAYRGRSPSPASSVTMQHPDGDMHHDKAVDGMAAPAGTRLRGRSGSSKPSIPEWEAAAASAAAAGDDLDSDSLLHARKDVGAKQQGQQQSPNLTWLPAVTREVLTVVKDANARSVLVGAAGATAREFGNAAVAGLGQLEVTRKWGTRGLVALLLLTFLTVCLVQEVLRAMVLAVLH